MKPRNSQTRSMKRYPAKQRVYNYGLSFAAREGSDIAVVKAALAVATRDHETVMALIAAGVDPWAPVDSSGRLFADLVKPGDELMTKILEAAMSAADPERFTDLLDGAVDMLSPTGK